ncbi:transporter substrate-binding domain-containing protein [Desulfobacterales bacterium HSG2]|nr:transporter substrate-binding domain-containing protein [Desulfobacterales bacterium HSG2]
MKKSVVTLIAAILLSLPLNAVAEEFVIAFAEWPPYTMMENKQPSGIDIEIGRELCKRVGIKPKFRMLPWQRALKYMKNGKVNALLTPKYSEERGKFMYYPSEPIRIEKRVLLVQKGSDIKVDKLDDLKGRKVGVVRGYSYTKEFDNYEGMNKVLCNDDDQLARIFAKKRVPIIAGVEEGSMKYLCKKAGVEAETVYVLGGEPTYIGLSRKATGSEGESLVEKFSKAVHQLKEEGFIKKTESKYF